jgi:hypothetical protein
LKKLRKEEAKARKAATRQKQNQSKKKSKDNQTAKKSSDNAQNKNTCDKKLSNGPSSNQKSKITQPLNRFGTKPGRNCRFITASSLKPKIALSVMRLDKLIKNLELKTGSFHQKSPFEPIYKAEKITEDSSLPFYLNKRKQKYWIQQK